MEAQKPSLLNIIVVVGFCLAIAILVFSNWKGCWRRGEEPEKPSIFDQSKKHIDSLKALVNQKQVQKDSIQKVLDGILTKGKNIAAETKKLQKVNDVYYPEKPVRDSAELRANCDSLYLLTIKNQTLLEAANTVIAELDTSLAIQKEIQASADSANIEIQDSQLKTNVAQNKEIKDLKKKLKRQKIWNQVKLIGSGIVAVVLILAAA